MSAQEENFRYLSGFIKKRAAILLEPGKEYLVEARLAPLARARGMGSVDVLIQALRSDERGALGNEVVEAMTTNETSFFRDIHPFDVLKASILPALVKARASSRTLRIWCAAASTGQEPYTIAMVIRENFPQLMTWNVQILGTDINSTVLARARAGSYRQLEVNRGLPASMLVKYFERDGNEWRVKPVIKDFVTFQELNLLDRWPLFTAPDVVFMRNVLIYFDVPTKKEILGRVRKTMSPDGYLVLGGGETTMNIDDEYGPVRMGTNTVIFRPKAAIAEEATRATA